MSDYELSDIHQYFEEMFIDGKFRPIIGNHETRLAASILYPLRGVSTVMRGEAGSAKTLIIRGITNLYWGPKAFDNQNPKVLVLTGTSDKAMLTDEMMDVLRDQVTHVIIPEFESIDGLEFFEDLVKAWAEGTDYHYMRNNLGRESKRMSFSKKPMLTALANENQRMKEPGEEIERRFMQFWTQSDRAMNTLVHNKKAQIEALPDAELYKQGSAKVEGLRKHLQHLLTMTPGWSGPLGWKIKNPCAVIMSKNIPKRFTISNTYMDDWHELVKGVTQFYYEGRMSYTVNGSKVFLSTPGDNFLAWAIGGSSVVYASLRLRDMGKVLMEVVPQVDACWDGDLASNSGAKSLSEIQDQLGDLGYERSKLQTKDALMRLEWAGYINSDGRDKYWKSRDFGDLFNVGVNWGEVITATKQLMREHYPELAEDYILAYCDNPQVRLPYPMFGKAAGTKVSILDLEQPAPINKQVEAVAAVAAVEVKPKGISQMSLEGLN